jgi:cellobiose phosphorylase
MSKEHVTGWEFINNRGDFRLENPHHNSYLYFPLVNEAGMMACVTPTLHGDIKSGHNTFLTRPVSVEDLHDSRSARNFWVHVAGAGPWSLTGNAAAQIAQRYGEDAERVALEAGMLWHTLIRENHQSGLRANITNFVPANEDQVELMRLTLTNIGSQPRTMTPIAAIPIYGRSADNLRDHRHVTSLLHRIQCHPHGVLIRPTLSFDERGHTKNRTAYTVLGVDDQGAAPAGFYPLIEDFIGEGGNLDWPESVVRPSETNLVRAGTTLAGYEGLGGLRFQESVLAPGESKSYILILGILKDDRPPERLVENYGTGAKFDDWLKKTRQHWRSKLSNLSITTGKPGFDRWVDWVAVQPTLRRIFGNSFLPYHDYGRGGRGWRDLWQDILALLLMETGDVSDRLWGFFAGVRMDGSNATIIGSGPGEFKADRNDIPRVWMDHGAWPLMTIRLNLDGTGDLRFLLRKQTYFKDHLVDRAQKIDEDWHMEQGMQLCDSSGQVYLGTILEHLLVQNLVPFFNVGEHNIIRLEGADWNDGMDMAPERGESVAFSALYAGNLRQLSELVLALAQQGVTQVELAVEIGLLLDTLDDPLDYSSIAEKQGRLNEYFETCRSTVSGRKISLGVKELSTDLLKKADWVTQHIRSQEWISSSDGYQWFNGYYDNHGRRVEGDHELGVRMTLTGQVFALMSETATGEQAQEIMRAADHYLFDPEVGGYRLNTDFGELMMGLGRAFGFAFGHKENGAMFSHMAVMYANALYQRGFVHAGHRVLDGIYQQSVKFPASRMYPGIPEYFNDRGRGMYPYLTGSASWYLLTMITQVFGINGRLGDLELAPKLLRHQFDPQGRACIRTIFAGRKIEVAYRNPERLDFGEYRIGAIKVGAKTIAFQRSRSGAVLARQVLENLSAAETHHIDVALEPIPLRENDVVHPAEGKGQT